jgi:hypothetical protein
MRGLYETLTTLIFKFNVHKKVYMHALRHVFVLLEKLDGTLFRFGKSSIEGNERVKQMRLTFTRNHNHSISMLNLWEN